MDRKGNLVQKYSFSEGLQKNNVRSTFIDQNRNLWLGLDDGIDFIAVNSAIKQIFPDQNKQSTSYAVRLFDKKLYIGTANGLYSSTTIDPNATDISLAPGHFSEVKNTKGQVWGLEEINNKLLLAHEDGAFVISETSAEQLYAWPGTWLFNAVSNIYPSEEIIAGTYTGLNRLVYKDGKFSSKGKIAGVDDPLRFAIFDQARNSIWASHPYHGVYKIDLSPSHDKITRTTLFTGKNGLPSALYNYIFKIKNRIVAATEDGIYEYSSEKNKFVRSPDLWPTLQGLPIQYLKEGPDGNIWFISNKEVGIVDFNKPSKDKPYSVLYFPELSSRVVGGFETIYPLDDKNIFIGANKGLYHINYNKYLKSINKVNVLIGQARVSGKKDSILFGGYFLNNSKRASTQDERSIISLEKSNFNNIHFEYSSTLYHQLNNIEFTYRLKGFDKDWSAWSEKSEKDYTNLPAGTYTFEVRARNNLGSWSDSASYTFKVLPMWYETTLCYFIYCLLLGALIWVLVKWQQKKHFKEQEKLKYLHQLEIERSESEIVKLKNEKLEADVNYKNKELATATMHLVQRGKVLSKIKELVADLESVSDSRSHSASFKQLFRLLNEAEKRDEDWDQFAIHFDHVHSNFLSDLKAKYPNITPNELKLCAYLKMNLSSKEIAQLMNVTIRAVEVSRYRLRKKLDIPSDVNLFDYLIKSIEKEKNSAETAV